MFSKIKQYPLSLLFAGFALAIYAIPGASDLLQLDFARTADGEVWRIVTGHWTHFGASHLFWDLLMFVILAIACESKSGWWFAPAIGLMAVSASAVVAVTCEDVLVYRGLSGLDTGLFTWFVAGQMGQSLRKKQWSSGWLYAAMLAALLGKLAFEAATGGTLFVAEGEFRPLVEVHIAGAIVGLLYSVVPTLLNLSGNWIRPKPRVTSQHSSAVSPSMAGLVQSTGKNLLKPL